MIASIHWQRGPDRIFRVIQGQKRGLTMTTDPQRTAAAALTEAIELIRGNATANRIAGALGRATEALWAAQAEDHHLRVSEAWRRLTEARAAGDVQAVNRAVDQIAALARELEACQQLS